MEILIPGEQIEAAQRFRSAGEEETERLRAQVALLEAEREALRWAVGHDELTGLPNRRLLHTLAPSLLGAGRSAVVMVLDLNGFKPINDTFGHEAGDEVLRIIGQRLADFAGDDLFARLGGDEFAAIVTSPYLESSIHWWRPLVAELSARLAEPMPVANESLTVTASIGVAPAQREVPIGELLHRADLAMYQAKMTGRPHAAWGVDAVDDPSRSRRFVELALFSEAGQIRENPPSCCPHRRDPAHVAPAGTYHRGDPVWVYRERAWRPGVVERASSTAVTATFRWEGSGTAVDTMTAQYVMLRAAVDIQLDSDAADREVAA